jgi:hypothetical protein
MANASSGLHPESTEKENYGTNEALEVEKRHIRNKGSQINKKMRRLTKKSLRKLLKVGVRAKLAIRTYDVASREFGAE